MDKPNIVWLIEDDPDQADQYSRLLEEASKHQLRVIFVPVEEALDNYTSLLADPETGAIILDQRLGEQSGVNYQGIDAAEYLRAIKPEIPIFILTQHGSDDLLLSKEENVEFVIDKDELSDLDHKAQVHAIRILRAIGRYEESLTEQQHRMSQLVDKMMSEGLDAAESTELSQLRAKFQRNLPQQSGVLDEENEREDIDNERFLNDLKEITERLEQLTK